MDQALGLRKKEMARNDWRKASSREAPHMQTPLRAIAVTSGKGGVGKTNVAVNLALAFDQMGQRVLIMDADLGLANVDILLGLTPRYNISHVLEGLKTLEEVLVQGPGKVRVMPASSGVQKLTHLTEEQKLVMLDLFDDLEMEIDVLIIDTGAGISDAVLYFNLAVQEKIVVVNHEPTSLTDAYALIKVLYKRYGERHFKILVNCVKNEKEGLSVFGKISKVADHFLNDLSLEYLGTIPRDPYIGKSVMQQKPVLEAYPKAPACRAFRTVAEKIRKTPPRANAGNIQFFWKRLLRI